MEVLESKQQYRLETGHKTALLFHRRRLLNVLVIGFGDGAALLGAIVLASGLRWALLGDARIPDWIWLLFPGWWVAAFSARLLPGWGMDMVNELRRVVILLCLLFLGTALTLFLFKESTSISRLILGVCFVSSVFLVPLARHFSKRLLISYKMWGVPAAIYGGGDTGAWVIRTLTEEREIGFNPVAIYDDNPRLWGDRVEGVPVLGETEMVSDDALVAILAMPGITRSRMLELLEGPLAHYKQVVISPVLFGAPSLWVKPSAFGGMLGLEITSRLLDPWTQSLKRMMDLCLVTLSLPLWGGFMAIIAAMIWVQDGHTPFFFQERIGQGGQSFKLWKFRTMVPDAEEILRNKLEEDPYLRAEWEANFKLRRDPRITATGRFLRNTSLDELPQLINILRGEMSLVGPRPLPAYHHDELPYRIQDLRTRVLPGMTGLWQVSGRSDIGQEGIIRWDAYYVQNWSIWLDIVVLARTFRAVWRRSGAY